MKYIIILISIIFLAGHAKAGTKVKSRSQVKVNLKSKVKLIGFPKRMKGPGFPCVGARDTFSGNVYFITMAKKKFHCDLAASRAGYKYYKWMVRSNRKARKRNRRR